MNNPESSNINDSTLSIVDQVRLATSSNPSLARELTTFLLDKAPDSQPVTKEQHPVIYDATKNPGKLFVPASDMIMIPTGNNLFVVYFMT